MEDFIGAYIERRQDVEILLTNRRIVAIHLGGIVVECQLKSFPITYHKIKKWEEKSQRKKSSMFNQTISNPGHGLQKAMRQMPELFNRAKLDQKLLEHLRDIQYPLGTNLIDYIDLRYIPQVSQEQSDQWKKSFYYVCGWLEKNKDIIL